LNRKRTLAYEDSEVVLGLLLRAAEEITPSFAIIDLQIAQLKAGLEVSEN
jgi:hypothetical protein